MWKDITGNSTVLDIRPIRDPAKACNDAARYAACPGSLAGLPFVDALELVEAMHGRRICGTWGTARSVSLRPPTSVDQAEWETVGEWYSVLRQEASSQAAKDILEAWRENHPLEAGIRLSHLGPDFEEFDLDCIREYENDWNFVSGRSPP